MNSVKHSGSIESILVVADSFFPVPARDRAYDERGLKLPLAYTSLAEAVVALGSMAGTIVVDCFQSLSDNLTVTASTHLIITPRGYVAVASGKTLTINGNLSVFASTPFAGPGSTVYGGSAMRNVMGPANISGNATVTPTASRIPIADPSGNLDGWHNSVLDESSTQRVFTSCLAPGAAGFLLISATAYFIYLGRTKKAITPKYIEFHVSTIGAGTQTAEVGFFSTPVAPNKAAQSVSKLVSTGTVDALTATGVKRNTTAFATSIPAGTHLWAGIRAVMVTTQPTIWGLGIDMAQGRILSLASATVLTGAGPWAGAIIVAETGMVCPDLRGTMD